MRDAQQKKRDRKRSAATEIERKHQEKIRLEAKLARDRAAAEEAAKVAAKAEVNYMQRVEATKAEKKSVFL